MSLRNRKGLRDRMGPGPAVCEGHIVRMVTCLCEGERSNRSTFVVPEGYVVGACLEGLGKMMKERSPGAGKQ